MPLSNFLPRNEFPASGDLPTLIAVLPAIGMLGFDGPEAASFLHSQLSNDVNALAVGRAHWTSYNSPKGRMLGSLLLAHTGTDTFRAFVAADLAEPLRRRLSMFVLRAKVTAIDLSARGTRYGVAGPNAKAAIAQALGVALEPGQVAEVDDCTLAMLPDGRVLVQVPSGSIAGVPGRIEAHAQAAPASHWELAGIAAGVPHITLATQDLFVPQTANWDLVGGINFQKGCYPGQEIVARMQYLGRLKERLQRFHVDDRTPTAGARLFSSSFGDQPCGTIVNAATSPEGGSDLLAVVQWAALDGEPLHLGAPDGPVLAPRPMAYTVPAPTAPIRPKL